MKARDVARALRGIVGGVRVPPRYPPGHYYSALSNRADAERAVGWSTATAHPSGIHLDHAAMNELAGELAQMWPDLDCSNRYRPDEMFCEADAAVYHSMIRHIRPRRIVEVGSGYSTAVALDTRERHDLTFDLTCIEPNPERLRRLLRPSDDVTLEKALVQDVPLERFDELAANDILFIDSTHVVKAGSDVVWNTSRVLPRLQSGVVVHIHDMFWPFEYKPEWLHERRDWTEIYLIHAFLSGNSDWKVLFFNDWVWKERPELVNHWAPETLGERPGGLWIQKV